MTTFLFWLANHTLIGQRSLEDVIGIFGHQLRALGHKAIWDTANDKFLARETGINVVVEGFTDGSINALAQGYKAGARFICLATEEPTPKGFNHGRDPEMVRRQEKFPEAAKYFEAIFHLVPGNAVTQWYNQFAPAAYVELGFAPTLIRSTLEEPQYNFGFFGSLTSRRLKILKRLAKQIGTEKAVRVEATFATQEERDRIMRQARVIVQVRKYEEMGLVSSSRCNTALHIGRPVVAEPHFLADQWRDVVKFSSHCKACAEGRTVKLGRNDVCDVCLRNFFNDALMMQASWRGAHANQFERFAKTMSPEICVGRALQNVKLDLSPQIPYYGIAS